MPIMNVGLAGDVTLLNSSVSSPIWCPFRSDTAIKGESGSHELNLEVQE